MKRDPIQVTELVKAFAILDNKVKIKELLNNRIEHVVVLDGISLTVRSGEILGVMGKNGAGKSTLLRVLGGIYGHQSGRVSVQGEKTAIFELGSFLNVYQTGREYCKEYFYITRKNMQREELERIIEDVYLFTGLEEFFDKPIHTYSSGMKAKLLFAVATALPTDIILIDEALVVGDEYFQGKAWKRLCGMLTEGTSGIIVTHDWVSLLKLCERAVILEDGKIGFEGNAREAVNYYLDIKRERAEEIYILDRERLKKEPVVWSGENDFEFSFQIQVDRPPEGKKLGPCLSIERFILGSGLDEVYNFASIFRIEEKGIYDITVKVPKLDLQAGNYWLSLFVSVPPEQGGKVSPKVYDSMSWLSGDAIRLYVSGENRFNTLIKGNLEWKIKNI